MRVSDSRRPGARAPKAPPADDASLASTERREAFLARLARMSEQERVRAARHEFDRWQCTVWAARYCRATRNLSTPATLSLST